jgi:hypothetical protein
MPTAADLTQSLQSVVAYDDAVRVTAYDAKMEIMHPNRRKMAEVVGAILPFPRAAEITIDEKLALYRTLLLKLRAGGWFVNADILLASHVDIETRFQTLRQAGFHAVDCFWKETREAVWGGMR